MNSMKHILGQMRRADHDYHLIEDGDRIAVGLSGGKDSSLLIYSLYIYQKLAEKSLGKRFEILGIHIDLNFGEEDFTPLWNFLDRYQIPYVAEKSRIADILGLYLKDGKVQCSRCSQLKKGAVIKTAKENGCNKIAYGHHADDAIETLLLNMIYGAKIASFEPNMYLSRENIRLIRPFIYCEERDILKTAKALELPRLSSGCPMDGVTKRSEMKELLKQIEHDYPGAKKNLLTSLTNTAQAALWQRSEEDDPE